MTLGNEISRSRKFDALRKFVYSVTPKPFWPIVKKLRSATKYRSSARMTAPTVHDQNVLACSIAYNELGGYCIPRSSHFRIASQTIMGGRVFEPETIEFIRKNVGQGDIVHAGAFFGDFLPELSRACRSSGVIWAFEPDSDSFRCAKITMAINGIENVKIFNAGLGAQDQTATLMNVDESGSALGELSYIALTSDADPARGQSVQLRAIDNLIPAERNVSIIHLDVEGHETAALEGARATIKRCKPIIIVETVPDAEWIKANLSPLGYDVAHRMHDNTVYQIRARSGRG